MNVNSFREIQTIFLMVLMDVANSKFNTRAR